MAFKIAAGNGRLQFLKRVAQSIPDKMPAQSDSAASTVAGLRTDFNSLLAKLRASGAMAQS